MSLSIKEAATFAQTPGECGMELPNPDRLAEQPGAVKLPGGKKTHFFQAGTFLPDNSIKTGKYYPVKKQAAGELPA